MTTIFRARTALEKEIHMEKISLEALGFTKEELQNRVVSEAVKELLFDEAEGSETDLADKMRELIQERVEEKIASIAAKSVLPNVSTYIENLCLQETNKWGEKKGEKKTFTEYLISRAEEYLTEKVDYQGKTKKQSGGFSWSPNQTRIVHLVHEHLQYSISVAMQDALKHANQVIVGGIEEAVKLKLREISQKLSVKVNI